MDDEASGLPKNNIYGKPYTYTVEETRLGYASTDADGKTTYTYKDVMDGTDPAKVNADTKYEKPSYSYKTVERPNGTASNKPTDAACRPASPPVRRPSRTSTRRKP